MATLCGLLAILMWGALALLGLNTKALPPFQLLFMCFLLSGSIMFCKRLVSGQAIFNKPTLSTSQWLMGITGLFGFHFCYFMALKVAPAIEVSLISYLWPVLLALALSSKANFVRTTVGGLLGFFGVSLVITGGAEFGLHSQYTKGYLLAFSCALIWTTYSWFLTRSKSNVDDVGWLSFAIALLSLVAHSLLEVGEWQLDLEQWLGVLLLGLGPVGGAFYLWEFGLKKGNSKLLASLSFAAPLVSAALLTAAGLITWSANLLVAIVLILFGAIVANKKPKRVSNGITSSAINTKKPR